MDFRKIVAFVVAAGLAKPLAFQAQGPIEPRLRPAPSSSSNPADAPRVNLRANTTLVLVPVGVTDHRNRPVGGLEKENFKVYDDQVEQQITSFSMEDDPIALCIVYDVSSSMGGNTKMAWNMAHEAVKVANPGDELCAVTLSSDAKLAMPLTADAGPRDIDYDLFTVKGGGTTALLDGVYIALNELRKSKKLKKVMYVISDGLDNNSRYSEREVLNAVKESEVLIYGMGRGVGNLQQSGIDDKQVLDDLTEATGGRWVQGGIGGIITDLRNLYVLGFSPVNPVRDGRYHRLQVKLLPPKGLPKTLIHFRTGYYAPVN